MMSSARNRAPFTASQWQELEQQALVFKYMVSGTPIPPHLIFSIKSSLHSSTHLFPHHPIGWGCYEMGFGRKVDPEPGRCRRTDGKKWRCSKEAYPDSKYCEKHMHRGRNRSRKPVEVSSSSTTNTSSQPISTSSSLLSQYPYPNSSLNNPFFYSQYSNSSSSSSSRPPDPADFSPHSFLDSASTYSHQEKDYRHVQHVDHERAFFPEVSGTSARSFPHESYQQLSMSSYNNKSYSNFQNLTHNNNNIMNNPRQEEQQHCFVLGTDFKSSARAITKSEKESTDHETTQRPLHHFFGDQWPPKTTTSSDSWLDLASNSTIPTDE